MDSVKNLKTLSLSQAIKDGRLQEFIAQEEACGVGSIDKDELDALIEKAIKPQQSEDRTSRSRDPDGSTEM